MGEDKLALLVATEKGLRTLQALASRRPGTLGLVSTFKETSVRKSFHEDIEAEAGRHEIPFLPWKELRQLRAEELEQKGVTAILTIGWRYLLPMSWADGLAQGIFVIHDSLLPLYRGFAPTATAILCGEREHGISLLRAAEEMDEGDILIQKRMSLGEDDYVGEVIARLAELYVEASLEFVDSLAEGKLVATKQNHSLATYSIWRDINDCEIDWSESAEFIARLVRAVSYPFVGAFTHLGDRRVTVHRAQPSEENVRFAIRQPGKVWRIREGRPTIVCGEGLLEIFEAEIDGESMLPIKKLRQRFGRAEVFSKP